jgi:Copper type II ascorbate-dependent monooxygenase, N-terminal domain/DOMON domain/Copper type II ascorbate-dependent monooxygenase, C-terminal domain
MILRPVALLLLLLFRATLAYRSDDATTYFGIDDEVYIDWVTKKGIQYTKHSFIPSTRSTTSTPHGAAIHWNIDNNQIHIAVAARATGWLAFGLSENGGMRGADVVIFTAANNHTLRDAHVLQELYPISDDCQNWELINSTVLGDFIIFEAIRELDTYDMQDMTMKNDSDLRINPTLIIMAWGDSEKVSHHGINRVQSSLRLFGNGISETQLFSDTLNEAEGTFELRANNYTIPSTETTYQIYCWDTNDLIALGIPVNESLHMIGAEAIISDSTRKYVHHFILRANALGTWERRSSNTQPLTCNEFLGIEMVYGWAPGGEPLTFPQEVGSPLGKDGFLSFQLEIHYNNPDLDQGMVDSSGLRLLWTTQKRTHDGGVLILGDPGTRLEGQPVGDGLSSASFDCPSTCSSMALDTPVTILREEFHMHISGVSARNKVRRNGELVHEAHVNFFDFAQHGSLSLQQEPYQIFAGDTFHPTCYYQNDDGSNKTFGFSSQEEMCMVFVYYFPRKLIANLIPFICGYGLDEIPKCNAEYTRYKLLPPSGANRTFGLPIHNGNCGFTRSAPEVAPMGVLQLSGVSTPTMFWNTFGVVLVVFWAGFML